MEFGEKLQKLRKSKGLTQEELAECLFVSRTAVSKWESGRGYPNIDSIKAIASFFSVTVDDLLSSEKILSIAEQENKLTVHKIYSLLFGIVDLFALMLIILPLYPDTVNGRIYSVNLFYFTETSSFNLIIYWILFVSLILLGILKIILIQLNIQKGQGCVTISSLTLSILTVLILILTKQVYATLVMFAFFIIKGTLYLKYIRI